MSFPLPDNILQLPDVAVKQIMKKVFARQNHGVAKSMKKMGYEYPTNFGVAIPQLRAIAEEFKSDHGLAVELRKNSDIREALILSSMLDEPNKLKENEILDICDKVDNIELVEQFSRNLLARIPDLIPMVKPIADNSIICTSLCFMSFAWGVKFRTIKDEQDIEYIIKQISKKEYFENQEMMRTLKFVMQVISGISDNYNERITELAKVFSKADNTTVAQLGNDYLWLNTM